MNIKIITYILIIFAGYGCTGQKIVDRVTPVEDNGRYSIKIQNQTLEINPSVGGRITSLKLNGKDFLTGKEVNDFNWGSTFWPSPQSEWNWPPSAEIDNKPYTARVDGKIIKMVSPADPKTGFVVTKEFSGNKKDGYYTLKYTITNRSDSVQKVAPWEITRVRTRGLAFFPMGQGQRTGGLLPLTLKKDGIIWFIYKEDKIPGKSDRQLYADGAEGWVAEVNGETILVKKFPDVPYDKIAPKEGDIELYASPVKAGKSYVEIENQGAYEQLAAGDSLTWEVKWYLRKLPDAIEPKAGNTSLVAFVRNLIN